jgi:GTP pyrophosphokinase
MGSIENQQLKDFAAQKSNTLMNFFKSKMKRTGQTADADIHKQVLKAITICWFWEEQDKLDYKLSACCNPIPGDPVLGLSLSTKELKFKKDCPNAISMQSNYAYRIMQPNGLIRHNKNLKLFSILRNGYFRA